MKEISMNNLSGLKQRDDNVSPYKYFKEDLEEYPFIILIGKYDHVLGPRAVYSTVHNRSENDIFVRNLLRDALNTKNQFVILDFNQFYAQIYKIEIEDPSARGRKQLYAIILLRDVEHPLIPILHFKRIGMIFLSIKHDLILADNEIAFKDFYKEVSNIYMKKDEILPLESTNMQIRSGVNTIQGFCELILEQMKMNGEIPKQEINSYIEMMLDSCKDIIETLEKPLSSACK
jgi:hypothetical protein